MLSGSFLFAADKPNILFILADDLGYGDVACYNEASKVQTPHLDRLAAKYAPRGAAGDPTSHPDHSRGHGRHPPGLPSSSSRLPRILRYPPKSKENHDF